MEDRREESAPSSDQNSESCHWADLHLWQIRFIRDLLFALVVFFLFWLGYAMRDVTVPLLVALLLAYLAEPAVRWMSAKSWIPFQRLGAVILFVSLFIIAVFAFIAFVVPPTVKQVVDLANEVESGSVRMKLISITEQHVPVHIQSDLIDLFDFLPAGNPDSSDANPDTDAEQLKGSSQPSESIAASKTEAEGQAASVSKENEETSQGDSSKESTGGIDQGLGLSDSERAMLQNATTTARDNAGMLLGIVRQGGSIAWSVILDLITFGILLFLIPFYFFFFSLWYGDVAKFIDNLLPQRERHRIRELLHKMDLAVAGFVRGRILIAVIMSIMFVVGYMFVGVPYAIILGILAGFISIVPYLGLVAIPVAIFLMFIGQLEVPEADRMAWWGILLWPTVVYTVINILDGWILTPLIQGKSTNLDPVTIFVAILAGGSVLGVYGMLISIPVAACLKILLCDVVLPKLRELGSRPPAGRPLT